MSALTRIPGLFRLLKKAVPVTISQADAEAGTSTADRIFTAQRVQQAIAALAGLQFVSTAAIGLATTVVVTGLAAGYDYIFVLEAFAPTDDDQEIWLRFSDDNGVSYEAGAADYQWAVDRQGANDVDASDSEIALSGVLPGGNDANNTSTLQVTLINPNASSEQTTAFWTGHLMDTSATPALVNLSGAARFIQGTDAVDAVQFLWEGGSTFKAQGDITVWRRKRS